MTNCLALKKIPPEIDRHLSESDRNFLVDLSYRVNERLESQPNACEELAEQFLIAARDRRSYWGMGMAYKHMTVLAAMKNDLTRAQEMAGKTISNLEIIGAPPQHLAEIYNVLGVVYHRMSDYEKAAHFFNRSLAIAEKLKNTVHIGHYLNNLGNVFQNQGHFDKAILYFKRALDVFETLNNEPGIARCNQNMANTYNAQKQYERGLTHLARALARLRSLGDEVSMASAYNSLGVSLLNLGKYAAAKRMLNRALRIFESHQRVSEKVAIFNNLGKIAVLQNDWPPAINYFQQAVRLNRSNTNKQWLVNSCEGLAEAYQKLGRYRRANHYLNRLTILKDELFNENQTRVINELDAKYERAKQEKQIAELQYRLDQQNFELKQMALRLADSQKLFARVHTRIDELPATTDTGQVSRKALKETLKKDLLKRQNWTEFESHFQQFLPDFGPRLQTAAPNLTPQEVKVCMLIRIELSSREIADVLFISKRCVDTHRYHIRQKLNLPPSANLSSFLAGLDITE